MRIDSKITLWIADEGFYSVTFQINKIYFKVSGNVCSCADSRLTVAGKKMAKTQKKLYESF